MPLLHFIQHLRQASITVSISVYQPHHIMCHTCDLTHLDLHSQTSPTSHLPINPPNNNNHATNQQNLAHPASRSGAASRQNKAIHLPSRNKPPPSNIAKLPLPTLNPTRAARRNKQRDNIPRNDNRSLRTRPSPRPTRRHPTSPIPP